MYGIIIDFLDKLGLIGYSEIRSKYEKDYCIIGIFNFSVMYDRSYSRTENR